MWFALALALGGRTVEEWKACMTQPEFLMWREFYRLYPFDDAHRYHRPAALISSTHPGMDPQTLFPKRLEFLAPEPQHEGRSAVDLSIMKALGVKPRRKKG